MKKILMRELLTDNEELGNVIDHWNDMYRYQMLVDENGQLYMDDLEEKGQLTEESSVKDMVLFYIYAIEQKKPYRKDDIEFINGKKISKSYANDYKVLLKNK